MRTPASDSGVISSTSNQPLVPVIGATSSSRSTDTINGHIQHSQASSSSDNFTFVNLSEDLSSLRRRTITNKEQRHTIRSHVMQRVRRVELAQGKTRPTGRDQVNKSGKPKPRRKTSDLETPLIHVFKDNTVADVISSDTLSKVKSPHPLLHLTLTPGVHQFDPFNTLPTNALPHQSSESLLLYCFDVMLPLTFAVETHRTRDRLARQGMVLSSKMSNPASFLGFLATIAAHRAIMYGRHRDLAPSDVAHDDLILDPDYVGVKHEATIAVRHMVSHNKQDIVDEQMLEACFGLVSTATIVGNLEEARVHLQALDRLLPRMELSDHTLMWLPMANNKVSVALLQRPVIPLLLERHPIPEEILQRISLQDDTAMGRLGHDFRVLHQLSDSLQRLLYTQADVCRLCQLTAIDPSSNSALETTTLARKATEVEFDLLDYPYRNAASFRTSRDKPQLPALESVVRITALGMLASTPYTMMPAAGNGRALTQHQKEALDALLRERYTWDTHVPKVILWVLFVFIQNSLGQPEQPVFTEQLAQISRDLGVFTWEDAEHIVYGFLYVPNLQALVWKVIWQDVCRANERWYSHQTRR